MRQIARLVPGRTVFFLCDVQERSSELDSPFLVIMSHLCPGSTVYGFDELVLTINKVLKVAKVSLPVSLGSPQNIITPRF